MLMAGFTLQPLSQEGHFLPPILILGYLYGLGFRTRYFNWPRVILAAMDFSRGFQGRETSPRSGPDH